MYDVWRGREARRHGAGREEERPMLILRMQLPDWSAALIVSVSVALALAVLASMFWPAGRRMRRPAADDAAGSAPERARPGLDMMLLVSALGIVGLALAVYLTRP
jgi:hypothetical protein